VAHPPAGDGSGEKPRRRAGEPTNGSAPTRRGHGRKGYFNCHRQNVLNRIVALLCFGLNPDMTTSTQKPSTWKTTIKAVKEEPSLLGVFLFSIALIATGILPIWLDASPSLAKWIDGCRWGAVGLFFSTLIAIFAKFTTTNEKIQVMQDSVEGRIEEVASRVITVEGHLQRERLLSCRPQVI